MVWTKSYMDKKVLGKMARKNGRDTNGRPPDKIINHSIPLALDLHVGSQIL